MFEDDDVDPEIREFLRRMFAASAALGAGPHLSLGERRALAERQRAPWVAGGPVMESTTELRVGRSGTRVRLHRPNGNPDLPVLVYLHGGGWTLFSIDTHDRLMREYAGHSGCAVLGVDYSLSPEHLFPRALDDIADVLDWLTAEGAGHGLDATRYALGGDSAGANLSLSSAIRARDAGALCPSALVLNYGAFDGSHTASFERYGDPDRYMLTGPEMDDFWLTYLGSDAVDDVLARPLHAELAGLPPTWLCVAECDVLLDENVALAQLLEAARVSTELRIYKGATHSFLEAVSISTLAERALTEASDWLREQLR